MRLRNLVAGVILMLPLSSNANAEGCLNEAMSSAAGFQRCLKLAEQGDADAQFGVGGVYDVGNPFGTGFIQESHATAFSWFQKAALQGNLGAQSSLGLLYHNGRGTAQDYDKAMYWWRKASDSGDKIAPSHIGGLFERGEGVTLDYAQAAHWYRVGVDRGDTVAEFLLKRLQSQHKIESP